MIRIFTILFLITSLLLTACRPAHQLPKLGRIYNDVAKFDDPHRNPVIVIPGLLGSRLVDRNTQQVAWGAFGSDQITPDEESGARLIALPMKKSKTLNQLRDDIDSDGALDRISFSFFGLPVESYAYYNILQAIGVGGYLDQDLGERGLINYGDNHFTCFQFDYDWRRDIVESAQALDRFIKEKRLYAQIEIEKRYGLKDYDVKFDIVAHSMGGLVARYYLRYGAAALPADGSLPELTWAGSKYINRLIMIGPPNAGSLEALVALVEGSQLAPLQSFYPSAIIGTMPSFYELLPRSRHGSILDNSGRSVADIYNPSIWQRNGWGLANPRQDVILKMLLPNVESREERLRIALDHQQKALQRARQFAAAMDVEAQPPSDVRLLLFAGDAEETLKTVKIDSHGRLKRIEYGAGDGTVLRSSALMDERLSSDRPSRLISPIHWYQVYFVFADHLGLTKNSAFTDNLLYLLLEKPVRN